MGNKIQLTIDQKDLFKSGTFLTVNEPVKKNYYYFPFWIEEDVETGETTLFNFDELPESLKNKIKEVREL